MEMKPKSPKPLAPAFHKHLAAHLKFRALCEKAVKLREAKKDKEADAVEAQAKKYAQIMLDIEEEKKRESKF